MKEKIFQSEIFEIIQKVTVICTNSDELFIVKDRIEAISNLLINSQYVLIYDGKLVKIYAKKGGAGNRVKLISSHIDCVSYKEFFARENGEFYEGIFDNAMTNAIIVKAMIDGVMPDDVIVAFTGDEESGCRGAVETMKHMKESGLEVEEVVVTDTTFEHYEKGSVSVENYFNQPPEFKENLLKKLHLASNVLFVTPEDAWPDESLTYQKYGQPTYVLCIPVISLGRSKDDMHSSNGLRVKKSGVFEYCKALSAALT